MPSRAPQTHPATAIQLCPSNVTSHRVRGWLDLDEAPFLGQQQGKLGEGNYSAHSPWGGNSEERGEFREGSMRP